MDNQIKSCQLNRFIIKYIPIQTKNRTTFLSMSVFCHYALNYFIINAASNTYNTNHHVAQLQIPLLILRILLAVLFIIFKHPTFLALNKLIIIIEILLISQILLYLEVIAFIAQLMMVMVWSLTKQQRFIHFDSRLYIFKSFLKQFVIHVSILIYWILINQKLFNEKQFSILFCAIMISLIDSGQIYYKRQIKKILLQIDKTLIILITLTILHNYLIITYIQYISFSIFSILIIATNILSFKDEKQIQDIDLSQLDIVPLQEKIQTFILIKQAIIKRDIKNLIILINKINEIDDDSWQTIKDISTMKIHKIIYLLNNYMFSKYKGMIQQSQVLQDLIIYLYSPQPKVIHLMDLQNFKHCRQYNRLIYQDINDHRLKIRDLQDSASRLKYYINQFVSNYSCFTEELMKERIQQAKIIQKGLNFMNFFKKIQMQIHKHKDTNELQTLNLINQFILCCLPERYHNLLINETNFTLQQKNMLGEILFGGQQDNKYEILSVNLILTKYIYLRKEQMLNQSLKNIISQYFLDQIIKHVDQEVYINQQDAQYKRIMMINHHGYAFISNYLLYERNHPTGRAWKMLLKMDYNDKAFVVLNSAGSIEQINQLSFHYGLRTDLKGLKLLTQIIDNLRTNQPLLIHKQTQILQQNDFFFEQDVVISIIEQLKTSKHTFLIVQISYANMKDHNKQDLNEIEMQYPNNFNFFYDWSGKISTYQPQIKIQLKDSSHYQKLQGYNYGQNIVQMRYFDNHIDYKSNFEEERDCASLPNRYQLNAATINAYTFNQRFNSQTDSIQLQFKIIFLTIIIICIILIAAFTFYLTYHLSNTPYFRTNFQIICKLHQKYEAIVILSYQPTYSMFLNDIPISSLINQQIQKMNNVSNVLYSLSTTLFSGTLGKVILGHQNSLNLLINQYILNPTQSNTNRLLTLLTNNIVPSYKQFIYQQIQTYKLQKDTISTIIMIVTSVLIFGLLIIILLLENRLQKRKKETIQILKFIKNDQLQVMSNKMIKFQQTWLQNIESKQIVQQALQQPNQASQNNFNISKRLITSIKIKKIYFFIFLWFILVLMALFNGKMQIDNARSRSIDFMQLEYYSSQQIMPLQEMWVLSLIEPKNYGLISNSFINSFNYQHSKILKIRQMSKIHLLSNQYRQVYKNFWQRAQFCQFINETQCPKIINGDLLDGGNNLISYLHRKLQPYTQNTTKSLKQTSKQTLTITLATFIYKYLSKFISINNKFIIQQYNHQTRHHNLRMVINYSVYILIALGILLLIVYYMKIRRQYKYLEQLLLIIPYDSIKNIQAFQTYFNKYYVQQ